MAEKHLIEHAKEMLAIGDFLVPYTIPYADVETEEVVSYLRIRHVIVDGYEVYLYFSKSELDGYSSYSLQIYGAEMPFLPFALICKIVNVFLGNKGLALTLLLQEGRMVYSWNKLGDKDGIYTHGPSENFICHGVEFFYFNPMPPP